MSNKKDTFNEIFNDPKLNKQYKATAEELTGHYASFLIRQAGLLSTESNAPLVVLDNACGSGIVSSLLYKMLDEGSKSRLRLTCSDLSELFVKSVSERIEEEGWKGAEAKVIDMRKMDLPSNHFTHVLTNFGISFISDPSAALNEWFRILLPSGICGLTSWSTIGWYPEVAAALATLPGPPPIPSMPEFIRSANGGDWHLGSYISQTLTQHGFVDVKTETVEHKASISSPAKLCETLGPMVGLITGKFWSEQQREELGPQVMPAVRKFLDEKYGDGILELDWVAIVATARKPAE
ncbi:MAG: hypothetical protein M1836_004158 [Candelina mexicana]|nr:MAG: hypothetical protein M1836_004158 [Candelina mexicana]